jgi:hypothetical protein
LKGDEGKVVETRAKDLKVGDLIELRQVYYFSLLYT